MSAKKGFKDYFIFDLYELLMFLYVDLYYKAIWP
jgi:hypothetical protein